MGTFVHFIELCTHIQDVPVLITKRQVDRRATAVIRTDRHINNILRVWAGLPQHRLCLLWAIRIVNHQF